MSVYEIPAEITEIISSVAFSSDGTTIVAGAWDSSIHIYTRSDDSSHFQHKAKIETDAPILSLCYGADDNTVFSAGLDHEVAQYSLSEGSESRILLNKHSQPANKIAYSKEHDAVLSTSWDETLHVHDPTNKRFVSIKLAAKPFALSLTTEKAVVTMAERKVHVFSLADLKALTSQAGSSEDMQQPIAAKPWQERESSLKFQTRDTACMPDGTGFAAASIEGRVGVEWFDEDANQNMYAFKCHREKGTMPSEDGTELPADFIYPVNTLAFHPVHTTTFATGGGDGVVALWDAKTKRRIRQYPKLPAPVAALDFSPDGKLLAIGISPGFEDGKEEEIPDPALIKVYIRELGENEAKGKPVKEKK